MAKWWQIAFWLLTKLVAPAHAKCDPIFKTSTILTRMTPMMLLAKFQLTTSTGSGDDFFFPLELSSLAAILFGQCSSSKQTLSFHTSPSLSTCPLNWILCTFCLTKSTFELRESTEEKQEGYVCYTIEKFLFDVSLIPEVTESNLGNGADCAYLVVVNGSFYWWGSRNNWG